METEDFIGAKIALLKGDQVLTLLRDDFDHIPFPNMWDLPGGGSEGAESPTACALRELHEEFGLIFNPERIVWTRRYGGEGAGGLPSYFFVADITDAEVQSIVFGNEGQGWKLAPVSWFVSDPSVVPYLAQRLSDYVSDTRRRKI